MDVANVAPWTSGLVGGFVGLTFVLFWCRPFEDKDMGIIAGIIGFAIGVVFGHSYGEYRKAALVAAAQRCWADWAGGRPRAPGG